MDIESVSKTLICWYVYQSRHIPSSSLTRDSGLFCFVSRWFSVQWYRRSISAMIYHDLCTCKLHNSNCKLHSTVSDWPSYIDLNNWIPNIESLLFPSTGAGNSWKWCHKWVGLEDPVWFNSNAPEQCQFRTTLDLFAHYTVPVVFITAGHKFSIFGLWKQNGIMACLFFWPSLI